MLEDILGNSLIDIVMYTPCIHGEVILASKARRKMDMDRSYQSEYSELGWRLHGGRRMILIVCRVCGKCTTVPKCINTLELCTHCFLDWEI